MTKYATILIDIFKCCLSDDDTVSRSCVHIYSDITDKMINNAFRGLKLPLIYDDILVIFDTSLVSNCRSGLVFIENGFFASRVLDTTYFVNYKDVSKCEILKNNLVIHIANGDLLNVCYNIEQAVYLKRVLETIINSSETLLLSDEERKTGPLREIKELISKKDLKKCQMCIHGAAAACGTIGVLPYIPFRDTIPITTIQAGMLIGLSQIFNEEITKATAQSLLMSFTSSMLGRNIVAVTVGLVPGVGNAVNLATAASLTESIGWTFVRMFSQDKEFYTREKFYAAVKYFQNAIDNISDENFSRFSDDIDFIFGKKTNGDRDIVTNAFFNVIAQYTFHYKVDTKEIFSVYAKNLKKILSRMEKGIVEGSQAQKYYLKFQNMNFETGEIDYEKLTEFVELFLGLYNLLKQHYSENGITKFQFDIQKENPDMFFQDLYIKQDRAREESTKFFKENGKINSGLDKNAREKNSEKQLYKKWAIQAITSFAYCCAADREGERV